MERFLILRDLHGECMLGVEDGVPVEHLEELVSYLRTQRLEVHLFDAWWSDTPLFLP